MTARFLRTQYALNGSHNWQFDPRTQAQIEDTRNVECNAGGNVSIHPSKVAKKRGGFVSAKGSAQIIFHDDLKNNKKKRPFAPDLIAAE